MGSNFLLIVFVAGAIAVLVLISRIMNKKPAPKSEQDDVPQEKELTQRFLMGQYLSGFPNTNGPAPIVFCGVTEDSFVFRKGTQGMEIGRIPRQGVRKLDIQPKNKQHCIAIDWADLQGKNYNTLFAFTDKNSPDQATQSANTLKSWVKTKASGSQAASA